MGNHFVGWRVSVVCSSLFLLLLGFQNCSAVNEGFNSRLQDSSSSHNGTGGGSGGGGGGGEPPVAPPPPVEEGGLSTWEDGLQPVREVHVVPSPAGNDSTGDGSSQRPYASLGRAVSGGVAPGTAIRLHPGTYAGGGSFSDIRGNASAPIWIGGVPGQAKPVIQGGSNAIHLRRPRYLVVHDIVFQNSSLNGINCDDAAEYANADAARYVIFRDIEVRNIGTGGNHDGLKLSGLNDFFVLNSVISNVQAGSGIDCVGCHRGVIAYNEFRNGGSNSIQTKGGSTDIDVLWNRFENAGQRAINAGGSTGFEYFRPPLVNNQANAEARRIRVLGNVIIGGENAISFVGVVDGLAAQNTIVNPTRWPIRILQETVSSGGYEFLPAQNNVIDNNIFYFSSGQVSSHVNVGANTRPESFVFRNNLWFAHNNPGSSTPTLPVTETGGVIGQNPGFVNLPSGDVHLITNSPARGRGISQDYLPEDADGTAFLQPPTIGAFQ